MRPKLVIWASIAALVLAAGCISGDITGASSEKKDALAQCLTEKGAKMYGAEWCPHCKNQKNEFGSSFQYIDYVECTQREADCVAAGINGYPTWIIEDTKYAGEQKLSTLAKISGCAY